MSLLARLSALSAYEKTILLLFLLTLPLVNPWVRGDGVGYYAYARALLIEQNLHFENDWRAANPVFVKNRVDEQGHVLPKEYTGTGHINNHFTVGPAMLWLPFLAVVHGIVLGLNQLGAKIPADGYSRPYIVTMALVTTTCGLAGLLLSFRLARKYFEERWAFLGTVGIWFGSSLPVYMYFNPSWSHAHSVFAVALFLWYWHRTRSERTAAQWALLGALAGLMIDVYYINAVLVLVPVLEALSGYARGWRDSGRLIRGNVAFVCVALVVLLPTFLTRQIINGHPLGLGYYETWYWTSPVLGQVLFSANHGLLSWTPILIPAIAGMVLFRRYDRPMASSLLAVLLLFYYLIACYANWTGLASFGNRFFISLTPLFILGLTATAESVAELFARARMAFAAVTLAVGLFVVWNLGFIFQWGTHLVPVRGPISWSEMVRNQFTVVPARLARSLEAYLLYRKKMMQAIETEDMKQLGKTQGK